MSLPVPAAGPLAPGVDRIVVAHAQRGISLQLALRGVLALFVVCTLILLPPDTGAAACAVIAAGYVLAALLLTAWLGRGGPVAIAWGWLGLYVDLLALSALCLVAGMSSTESWTAYVLLGGFFLLPVLAATQLRWGVCASVVIPTVAFYAVEAVVTRVGAAAIGLSRIQRSRVLAIQALVSDRTQLLTELMTVADSERQRLAENLHDGALQYVLAARMDLDDARELADPRAFDRLDLALTQSAQLLRSTVATLHPAVLEQSGLAVAVSELAGTAADRAELALTLDTAGWPAGARTSEDLLLFGTARELLANVVRHAHASALRVELTLGEGRATLVVADDGVGADAATVAGRVAQGHIGLDSHRVKIESAGGQFRLETPVSGGTLVRAVVPVSRVDSAAR
jgi:two-component system NarL family sensor kinase